MKEMAKILNVTWADFFADFQHTMIEDHCVMATKGKEGGEGV